MPDSVSWVQCFSAYICSSIGDLLNRKSEGVAGVSGPDCLGAYIGGVEERYGCCMIQPSRSKYCILRAADYFKTEPVPVFNYVSSV